MMRRYFDAFQSHGWAATLWSYKILNREGGAHPDSWYMVTNRQPLAPPDFKTDSAARIEDFCRSLSTMEYAEATGLRTALRAPTPPPPLPGKYAPVVIPDRREPLPGWTDVEVGGAFPAGASALVGPRKVKVFGGGRDVYDVGDDCHFLSRPAATDFRLQAEVSPPAATQIDAKAGLMFRASAASDAATVLIHLKPSGQCLFAYRPRAGAKLIEAQILPDAGAGALRLVRHGAAFEVSVLNPQGQILETRSVELTDLPAVGVAGLFVLSHDAMLLSEATFGKVEWESPVSSPAKP